MSDKPEIEFDWEDDDDEEFLAAWAEMDRQAIEVLQHALGDVLLEEPPALGSQAEAVRVGVAERVWPFEYFRGACGWDAEVTGDDLAVWLTAAAAVISPEDLPEDLSDGDIEELASIGSLEHAEWLAAVLGLVRRGVGAQFDEETWFADLGGLPEIEADLSDEDPDAYALAAAVITPLWQAIGVLDEERRLTDLGRWGLPQALRIAWGSTEA